MKTQTITHHGKTYTFSTVNGLVHIPYGDIPGLLDSNKLLLYFFAGCGLFRLEKETFTHVARTIARWIDRKNGGLNPEGTIAFGSDLEVIDASNQHKAYLDTKRKEKAKPASLISEAKIGEEAAEQVQSKALSSSEDISNNPSPLEVISVEVDKLVSHPLNPTIYDSVLNPALSASVEEYGVLVPIRITRDFIVLDGHQRVWAAKEAGYKTVSTIIVELPPEKHLELLLEYNRYREKTIMERLREYRVYLQIEKTKAIERAGTRTDLGQNLPPGENYGKSRDHAAMKVNLSGRSAELGLRVLEEIEKHEKSGEDSDGVARMKVTLTKSILGASKLALQIGWLDIAVKKRTKKKPRRKTKENSDEKDDPVTEGTTSANSQSDSKESIRGWLTDELLAEILAEIGEDEARALNSTVRRIRPALYQEFGTAAARTTAPKLRQLAHVIIELAQKCESLGQ